MKQIIEEDRELRIIEGLSSAKSLLSRQTPTALSETDEHEQIVRQIINDVQDRGDAALLDYTSQFDKVKLTSLEATGEQVTSAYREIDDELLSALKIAAERIRDFHIKQLENFQGRVDEIGTGWLVRPLDRVGIHVPGFTAPLPSSLLMTAIPAKVAGVKEIIVVTPPQVGGVVSPITLVAADIAGVDRVFSVAGAQAIAALAFGTKSIPAVNKICGPGNIYVILAKKMLYGVVGIDALQGPSEVLIIADETADSEYCAADLLAQAEHHFGSSILVTTSRLFADKVNKQIERQLEDLPNQTAILENLKERGIIAVISSTSEAIELANLYAPEHVCLMVAEAAPYIDQLSNTGCIVAGNNPTVVFSDYVAGPSHALPTEGAARFSSPLNVSDFIKITNIITVDEANLKALGEVALTIAKAEGLEAHARAVEKRLLK